MNYSRHITLGLGIWAVMGAISLTSTARADEPIKAGEPKVLTEPGEVTTVVDAFDGDDPFDLNITLGYQQTWKSANIFRETSIRQDGLTMGGYTADTMNVAKFSEATSRLNTRLDIGLYKDLALYLRMPIILSNSRELKSLGGSDAVQDVVLQGAPGEQLFKLPFKSPNRSGIEYLAVGLDFDILSQERDRTKPTWLFGIEGRFNVSEPMHACSNGEAVNQQGHQVECAYPSDVNRNGSADGDLEGNKNGTRDPGVSRGTTGLEVHTIVSRRIKYVEPYGGFKALFEFPVDDSDYGLVDLKGSLVNHPPLVGTVVTGVQVIPWENREKFERLTFDTRVEGTYHSEGRDYSELFDALGSSDAPSLRRPNYAAFHDNPSTDPDVRAKYPSVVDPSSQKVYFNGLTDVQAYGSVRASGSVTWQTGQYIKFQLGVAYTYDQPHFITMDQPCNPDEKSTVGRAGPCRNVSRVGDTTVYKSTGIPNPNYRPVINQVGRRFKVSGVSIIDLWFRGVVMF